MLLRMAGLLALCLLQRVTIAADNSELHSRAHCEFPWAITYVGSSQLSAPVTVLNFTSTFSSNCATNYPHLPTFAIYYNGQEQLTGTCETPQVDGSQPMTCSLSPYELLEGLDWNITIKGSVPIEVDSTDYFQVTTFSQKETACFNSLAFPGSPLASTFEQDFAMTIPFTYDPSSCIPAEVDGSSLNVVLGDQYTLNCSHLNNFRAWKGNGNVTCTAGSTTPPVGQYLGSISMTDPSGLLTINYVDYSSIYFEVLGDQKCWPTIVISSNDTSIGANPQGYVQSIAQTFTFNPQDCVGSVSDGEFFSMSLYASTGGSQIDSTSCSQPAYSSTGEATVQCNFNTQLTPASSPYYASLDFYDELGIQRSFSQFKVDILESVSICANTIQISETYSGQVLITTTPGPQHFTSPITWDPTACQDFDFSRLNGLFPVAEIMPATLVRAISLAIVHCPNRLARNVLTKTGHSLVLTSQMYVAADETCGATLNIQSGGITVYASEQSFTRSFTYSTTACSSVISSLKYFLYFDAFYQPFTCTATQQNGQGTLFCDISNAVQPFNIPGTYTGEIVIADPHNFNLGQVEITVYFSSSTAGMGKRNARQSIFGAKCLPGWVACPVPGRRQQTWECVDVLNDLYCG
ncbi:hypothetical protein BD324DRAFT_607743 [Kockovaella imperatae]|uniref:Ig-like domain-containing protein n=1 Tax=Kockovaella imperatae TaxID=4999 RepID=A0A1Y1UJJ4_9TREE|nr:hypothetical protein BD324DRAFT_607743 [Kockovaella imperatae]ORX38152.1 hypothetical protein BD324DRAFT_607743 [Kockovaella imperatae]